MKKVITIILCFLFMGYLHSNAQTISNTDSLRRVQFQKRKDSIAAAIKQRQLDRVAKQDSIQKAKKAERDNLRLQHKKFISRKKERERIRDSIARESEKAAAARKAYKKSLKKKKKSAPKIKETKKKTTTKKKIKKKAEKSKNKEKQKKVESSKKVTPKKKVKKKAERIKKTKKEKKQSKPIPVKKKNEVVRKKVKKKKAKENKNAKEKKARALKKQNAQRLKILEKESATIAKRRLDSLAQSKKKGNKINKERLGALNNGYKKSNFFKREIIYEAPDKKRTFFSFQFGPSIYIGDLGGGSRLENNIWSDFNTKENTYFYGFSLTHLRREAIGVRLSYVFGKIAGSDKNTYYKSNTDPSYSRFIRNLDFQSKISEGSLMLELHPFKFLSYSTKLHNSFFQPYALIGIGTYSFNPQGSYFDPILDDDVWVDLQPLSTEGQGFAEHPDREPYKLTQWNIPYGAGINYEISPSLQLGIEVVGRKLFTDYLDDVSTNYIEPELYDNYLTPENVELANILNNKSVLIDAERAYKPGNQRGNSSNPDLFLSISGRLVIKINRNKNKKKIRGTIFKYDDNEICE